MQFIRNNCKIKRVIIGELYPDFNHFEYTIDNKWQYNLKTLNYTAAGTYTIYIKSEDISEYTIDQSYTPAQFVIKE